MVCFLSHYYFAHPIYFFWKYDFNHLIFLFFPQLLFDIIWMMFIIFIFFLNIQVWAEFPSLFKILLLNLLSKLIRMFLLERKPMKLRIHKLEIFNSLRFLKLKMLMECKRHWRSTEIALYIIFTIPYASLLVLFSFNLSANIWLLRNFIVFFVFLTLMYVLLIKLIILLNLCKWMPVL